MNDFTDTKLDLKAYDLQNVPGITLVGFYFFEGKIYAIRMAYDVAATNRLGGWDIVVGKLVDRFGKADGNSKGTNVTEKDQIASFFWNFSSVSRYIEVGVQTQYMYVEFTDTDLFQKLQDKKKALLDLGF